MSNHSEDSYEGEVGEQRRRMPTNRTGRTIKVEITSVEDGQVQEGYITANSFEDGTLGEIFLSGFGKSGSTLEGWIQVAAMLFSIAIQYGAEFPMLARKVAHTKFPPYGPTNDPEIPYCRSVPDYVVRRLAYWFGTPELRQQLQDIDKELAGL